ncbi:MAG: hypothetical protein WBB98_15250 [Xanthobacteraceae bacterium]
MILNTAELVQLESGLANIGIFFRLETDPVVRIWLGVGNIEPGINVLDPDGAVYKGAGVLAPVPAFKQLINGAAQRVEFSASGVSGEILAIASGGDAEQVKGKRCSVGFAIFDGAWQMLGPVKWVQNYIADFLGISQDITDDSSNPIVRTVTLSVGSLTTARRRPSYSYFTDQDQQARFAGDKFCERTPKYATGFNKTWPRF